MLNLDKYDWAAGTATEHLNVIRSAPQHVMRDLARSYDWRHYPETSLGWLMAQKCIDLPTAISAFFNGGPERFNYLHKRDVPHEFHPTARILDNICLRVNSGFYLASRETKLDKRRLRKWLAAQHVDRNEGQCGRWVLDESILDNLFASLEPSYSQNPLHDALRDERKLPSRLIRAIQNRRRNATLH